MALTVLTWRWGSKYSAAHVSNLAAGVARHLQQPFRFVCVTDQPQPDVECWPIEDPLLLKERDGCYARLRMFDPIWQARHKIDKLACFDLDLVITRQLDPLFSWPEAFVILGGGHYNPCPFNGSVMMLKAGARPFVWYDFNVDAARKIAFADGTDRGTDQTWIAHKVPHARTWTYRDGIYSFKKPGWPDKTDLLPKDARIVAFPGHRDPSQFMHLPWVKENWRVQNTVAA